MDIFTHAVLPFALFWLLRRPVAERLAAGLGAAMPDMDVLLAWMTRLHDGLYAFGHRGWSHSVWGAPLFALAGLVVVTRPWWSARWPRMAAFRLDAAAAAAAVLGAWSHVALDSLTITGVPALWPLVTGRVGLPLFFFSSVLAAVPSAYVVWRLFRGTLGERLLRRAVLALAVLLVLAGGLRAASMPPAQGGVVQPTPLEVWWVVAAPAPGGWDVADAGWLHPGFRTEARGNASPEAAGAIAAAEALGPYTAWRWRHPAPVVNATAIEGGWRVEFRDAVALHRQAAGGLLAGGFAREHVPLVVEVVEGRARLVERPAGWGLGG